MLLSNPATLINGGNTWSEDRHRDISLVSPRGLEPLALQWETWIPAAQMNVADASFAPSVAVRESGKNLVCESKTATRGFINATCILAGGQQRVPDGVIAVLNLRVRPDARIVPTLIRIDRALAVSGEQNEVPLKRAEAVIAIQEK